MDLAKTSDEIEERALLVILMQRLGVERLEIKRSEIARLIETHVKRSERPDGTIVFSICHRS